MSEFERVRLIVSEVSFPGYTFEVYQAGGYDLATLRVVYNEPDVMSGVVEEQRGRPWLIPPGWEPIQIVQTCLKALLTSLEHRGRENLTYRGRAVFQPHWNLETLWQLAPAREREAPPVPFVDLEKE